MKKINLRTMLVLIGATTIIIPTSLGAIACGNKQTDKEADTNSDEIIKSINKLTNLEINITSKEEGQTKVLDLLKDPKLGVAEAISKKNIKDFKKNLFRIDTVTTDKEGKNKIRDDDKIESNKSYYFSYTYNNKASKTFVSVKIVNNEKLVVDGINQTKFKTYVLVNSTASDLEKIITKEFIESQLNADFKKIFNKDSFKLQQINNENDQKLSDADLKTAKEIQAKIVYTYGTIIDQKTTLTIIIIDESIEKKNQSKIVHEINKTVYQIEILSKSTVKELESKITGEFIKNQFKNEELKKVFKDDLFKLKDFLKNDYQRLKDFDLQNPGTINVRIQYDYGSYNSWTTNLTIKLIAKYF